jgi:pyruvate dehydrogenase E2 component (dihydrolipoamide acetyltransferase)
MATAVIMPKQGQSVETCIITKWFKKKGDIVSVGDILFSYETDKASFDLESPAEGIILDIFSGEGAEVPVLVNVAAIGKAGESAQSFNPNHTNPVSANTGAPHVAGTADAINAKISADINNDLYAVDDKIRISPRARRMAKSKGLDCNKLRGTGPNGRIITRDIEKGSSADVSFTKESQTQGSEYSESPLSNVRKIIARAMHASLQNSAQLTHHMSADVRSILEARLKIKKQLVTDKDQLDITLNDMICWCVIKALVKYPEANSHFLEDRIRTFNKVHLGLAVDTLRGLMVPAVKNAGAMNLTDLSKELRSAAEACRKSSINPELINSSAATFTVSNLGNYGVEMFTPVINLPQVAILGVCTIITRPANIGNNIFGFVPYIGLSLTYDHRAIDGGPATLFLKEIKEQIEAFRY